MANSEMRRGNDPATGKPYEPAVIERGSPPLDLSAIADRIKAFPEVDPDEEQRMLKEIEEATDDETRVRLKQELQDMFDKAAAEQRKYERPRQTVSKPQPVQPEPQPAPQSQPAPQPAPQPVRMTVEAPSTPPEPQETKPQVNGIPIIAFGQTMLRVLGGLEHEQQRVKTVRRKFLLEVTRQVAMGANLSAQTVIKSFIKVKATKS
jgi:hypothetical protein